MLYHYKIFRFLVDNKLINPIKFSTVLGRLASGKFPGFILIPFLRFYIYFYKIKLDDFDINLKKVKSFNEFFIRKLKPGVRDFRGDFMSPADSQITDYGYLTAERTFEVKGLECDHKGLLNSNNEYENKSFAIFYLSPADYHRFHSPFDIKVDKISYIPGKLHSVKPKKTNKYSDLYCLNRRVIISGTTKWGRGTIILVGALVVGKIVLHSFKLKSRKRFQTQELDLEFKAGEEMGYFELGSTVILMMENEILNDIKFDIGTHVNVGDPLLRTK